MVEFSEGKLEGGTFSVRHVRTIQQSSIGNCPHFIFDPGHYREDETCRCNDPSHTDMAEWGYAWDGNSWN
jgi:hypothetical protein